MSKFKPGDRVIAKEFTDSAYWNNGKLTVIGLCMGGFVRCQSPIGRTGMWQADDLKPDAQRDYVADHARRTLRAAGLSAKDARRIVQEIRHSKWMDLSTFSRKLPVPLSNVITGGFPWAGTSEGIEYWATVAHRAHTAAESAD